jgi:hypothetical protein
MQEKSTWPAQRKTRLDMRRLKNPMKMSRGREKTKDKEKRERNMCLD